MNDATCDTLHSFLTAITEHPDDWYRWSILADWFADNDDDVGEQWARWVEHYKIAPSFHDSLSRPQMDLWYWGSYLHEPMKCGIHILPAEMYIKVKIEIDKQNMQTGKTNFIGRETATECYELLLKAWRSFSDEERYSFRHSSEPHNLDAYRKVNA